MTKHDTLDAALVKLTAGITAHVDALVASRADAEAARALADDESYLASVATTIDALTEQLAKTAPVPAPVEVAPLPTFLVPPAADAPAPVQHPLLDELNAAVARMAGNTPT